MSINGSGDITPVTNNIAPQINEIFVNNPKSDVILHSSDNIEFQFIKSLLSLSSSVFETMFELPQSEGGAGNDGGNDLPVIPLTEDSKTLEQLLLFCYPMAAMGMPKLAILEDVQAMLGAAIKYDMRGLEKHVRHVLVEPRFGEKDPMRVFAIACRYKLAEEIQEAAKYTLRLPILQRPYAAELEYITGGHIQRLQEYYGKCIAVAQAVGTTLHWLERWDFIWFQGTSHSATCPAPSMNVIQVGSNHHYTPVRLWWWNYLQSTLSALVQRPCGEEVRRPDLRDAALRQACQCSLCGSRAFQEINQFIDLYANEVDRVVSEVSIAPL